MKKYTRFTLMLLLTLLLAVPLAAPQTVQAQIPGFKLEPGHYKGTFFFLGYQNAHRDQTTPMGGFINTNVREKWDGEGTVDVVVTSTYQAVARVKLSQVQVTRGDKVIAFDMGVSCMVYFILVADGTWAPTAGSYNRDYSDFVIPLKFKGISSYYNVSGQGSGSLKVCSDKGMVARNIDTLKIAMNETSINLIKELDLMVYWSKTDSFGGPCKLTGFDAELDFPDGHVSRTSGCNWQVFPVQDKPKKGWWQQ
jgi:hypothetical protein